MDVASYQFNMFDLIEIKRKGFRHWCIYVGDDEEGNKEVVHFFAGGWLASSKGTATDLIGKAKCFLLMRSESDSKELVGKVQKEKLVDVIAGAKRWRVNNLTLIAHKLWLTPLTADAIQKNITEALTSDLNYNLFAANCEHFVTAMKFGYGFRFSSQVTKRFASVKGWSAGALIFCFIVYGILKLLSIYNSDLDSIDVKVREIQEKVNHTVEDVGIIMQYLKLSNLSRN